MKELYKVFYHNEKELVAYTLRGTFDGEELATKQLLSYENGIDINDIVVRVEER